MSSTKCETCGNFVMKFDTDFEAGTLVGKPVGRLQLAGGGHARLILLPDGLHIFATGPGVTLMEFGSKVR